MMVCGAFEWLASDDPRADETPPIAWLRWASDYIYGVAQL